MTKSQFNIKISKDLLIKIKRQAMMSGKSLTEHITDLITTSLSENDVNDLDYGYKLRDLENRLMTLESVVQNREYVSEKLKPFTNLEALNCTKFMRGLFDKEFEKKEFNDKSEAFEDLFNVIKDYDDSSLSFADRLKEIMLSEKPSPWSGKELNELTGEDKWNCSIRKGLITWTGITGCPSQQEICDKGEELLSSL